MTTKRVGKKPLVSVNLPREVHQRARLHCTRRGASLLRWVTGLVEAALEAEGSLPLDAGEREG